MIKFFLNIINLPMRKFIYYVIHPIRKLSDILINNEFKRFTENPKNPLNKYGKRVFSQCDEDGITLEIVKRLKIGKGVFLEIGCDNGLQNNTLVLASIGWKGIWADTKDLAFNFKNKKRLAFFKQFITEENILNIIENGLKKINVDQLDCVSIDIDGADYFIIKKILEKRKNIKFFIVEIKQQFPPPIKFVAKKKEAGCNGASLTSFNSLFNKFGYTLVCVSSIMGHNAFFIKNDYLDLFQEVPKNIEDIYVLPNYWSFSVNFNTSASKAMVENIFSDEE